MNIKRRVALSRARFAAVKETYGFFFSFGLSAIAESPNGPDTIDRGSPNHYSAA